MNQSSTNFSVIDLFSIGIGPSSSHTVGPMRAAAAFVSSLGDFPVEVVRCDLFGSLADTGRGHGTDQAIILGFLGHDPKTVPVDAIKGMLKQVKDRQQLTLPDGRTVAFVSKDHLVFHRGKTVGKHTNAMHFSALGNDEQVVAEELIYSVGGGFTIKDGEVSVNEAEAVEVPYPFHKATPLLEICRKEHLAISEVVLANEEAFRPEKETRERIDEIWAAMDACITRGLEAEGVLPGGLKVTRRARKYHEALTTSGEEADSLAVMDWVNLYALAVNEENAAGGRVVTAPTNGAAGVIPAVFKYAEQFRRSPHPDAKYRFFLTAGAIGSLYKKNASISGADVGCQGEVGVACSMAAGALTEYLGGTVLQVEFAAEIGMEHNLGLTCDPIGGLVQIPCIERNAMGAIKAINASRLAMKSAGIHHVSLDKVIATMKATGADMLSKYKETARGGLAVNIVEC
jgi:L-serine dehydratase